MYKKNISAFVWRAIFTLAYTLTVLPFTVNFFKSIASPSSTETLMLIFPLVDAHNFTLPIFLACLEFASIGLACSMWQKKQGTNKLFILLLFLACQTIPMLSLYYDVRGKDYQMEKKNHDSNKKELMDSLSNRIKSINGQILALSKNITDMKKERHDTNKSINQLLFIRKESQRDAVADMKAEIRERKKLRERDEEKVADIFREKKALEADLRKWEDELQVAQSQTMRYGTQLEYIVRELFSYKSTFAGFISFLFPLTILSVAFVLPKGSENNYTDPSFQFHDYLKYGSLLPADLHLTYAKMLTPSVSAYMTALLASKTLANEGVALHLQNDAFRQIIDEAGAITREIQLSKLDENSKNYLISEINEVMTKNLLQGGIQK